jgi:hypothetical protein
MTEYRAYSDQMEHYFFGREHDGVPTAPIVSPADWRAPNGSEGNWLIELPADEVDELGDAVARLRAQRIEMAAVTRENFVLDTLATRIADWQREISAGRGFIAVRGLPVDRWGEEDSALAFWGIGHHLGLPGAQNPQNELLGHVIDYGEEANNPMVRRYRTKGTIEFHCDPADMVGLLCLNPALRGGQSRIVSSIAVFNEIQRSRPDLVERLFEPFLLDLRGDSIQPGRTVLPVRPCCHSAYGQLSTFYHSEYFRSAARHEGVEIDSRARALLDLYDEICARPSFQFDMWLEKGDMQFISNHTIVHARTSYEDSPDQRRHLLRLWLSYNP